VTRPNLLLIMVDQLAGAWLPVYGHPVVQSSAISALARDGVVFESAYCASPLCAPSRASVLTGRLPSRTGVYDNGAELPAATATVAHHLRAQGYATSVAGKMHFVGPDQLHGFEERLTPEIYPAGFDWTPDWSSPPGEQLAWYHTMESVLRPGRCEASLQQDYDDEVAFAAVRKIFDLARGRAPEPFFLVVSFSHPHDPWEVRGRYWDLYAPDAIDLPAVPVPALAEADPHSRRLREMIGIDDAALTDEQIRNARHAYYAAISYVDERIGELLRALRDTGLDERTVVAFSADHGELLGERGLWYKMSLFEPSVRVPLIMAAPGRLLARRVAEPVSLLDLAPTLLDLAGDPDARELGAGMDGSSLTALLEGRASVDTGVVASEYLAEGLSAPAVMIRRGSHKLVRCEGDPDQLFDLAEDPHELVNLAEAPSQADVHRALGEEVAARWDLRELERRVIESQRERRVVAEALAAGRPTSWDFRPGDDAAGRYVRAGVDLYEQQRRARLDARPD
jgi:choline-sulfatase